MKCSIFLLFFFVQQGISLFFILGEKDHRCFLDDYQEDVILKFQFNATNSDASSHIGLAVRVIGPKRDVLLRKEYASQSTVTFHTDEPGEYAVCVATDSTKWAMYATDTVLVHFRYDAEYVHEDETENGEKRPKKVISKTKSQRKVRRPNKKSDQEEEEDSHKMPDDHSAETDSPMSGLTRRMEVVQKDLKWLQEMQKHNRYVEARFRKIAETTNKRVLIWGAIQLVILIFTGWWRLRSLTSFFIAKKLV